MLITVNMYNIARSPLTVYLTFGVLIGRKLYEIIRRLSDKIKH